MEELLNVVDRARYGALVRSFAGLKAVARWLLTVVGWVVLVVAVDVAVRCSPSMTGLGTWLPTAAKFALLFHVLMSIMEPLAWGAGMLTPAWQKRVAAMPRRAHALVALLVLGVAAASAWGMAVWYGEFSEAVLDMIRQMSWAASCPER